MWCAPKLDAPHATPRRPLRVSGTIQSRARRPPAPPPPPPGEPSSAPHRSILGYMAGRPRRSRFHARQSLGRREGRGHPGAGGQLGVGCRAPPHRARAPILSLLRTVFSGSWSPPRLVPQRIQNIAEAGAADDGGLVLRGSPREQRVRRGRLLPDFQGSGLPEILPKSLGRERVQGVGSGDTVRSASRRVLAST